MSPLAHDRTPAACVSAALLGLGLLLSSPQGWAAERGLGRLVPKTPPTGALLFVGVAGNAAGQALVQRDQQQAQTISQALGMNAPRVITLLDKDATAPRIEAALTELRNTTQGQGTVLVYFSGNGTRAQAKDTPPDGTARCQSGLVLGDGSLWWGATLRQQMRDLSAQVDDVLLVVDAGFTPAPLAAPTAASPVARYTPPPAGQPPCPAGPLFEGVAASAQRGLGRRERWVAFHAADIALGTPGEGGFIGAALQQCLNGTVEDLDHSGGIAARELAACVKPALQALAQRPPAAHPSSLPDIRLAGDTHAVLAYRAETANPKPAAGAPAPQAPAPSIPPGGPRATLMDIHASRDARVELTLTLVKPRLKIGEDLLSLTVASSHGGYLYILMAGSDGQQFDLLFPNQLDQDNRIGPQSRLTLPRPDWEVVAGGPAGSSTLLAIVSPEPRDFSALVARQTGPFSVLDGRQGSPLQRAVAETLSPGPATSSQRGLRRSPVGYGAAWVEVQEY